jgi:hypothetical protein
VEIKVSDTKIKELLVSVTKEMLIDFCSEELKNLYVDYEKAQSNVYCSFLLGQIVILEKLLSVLKKEA